MLQSQKRRKLFQWLLQFKEIAQDAARLQEHARHAIVPKVETVLMPLNVSLNALQSKKCSLATGKPLHQHAFRIQMVIWLKKNVLVNATVPNTVNATMTPTNAINAKHSTLQEVTQNAYTYWAIAKQSRSKVNALEKSSLELIEWCNLNSATPQENTMSNSLTKPCTSKASKELRLLEADMVKLRLMLKHKSSRWTTGKVMRRSGHTTRCTVLTMRLMENNKSITSLKWPSQTNQSPSLRMDFTEHTSSDSNAKTIPFATSPRPHHTTNLGGIELKPQPTSNSSLDERFEDQIYYYGINYFNLIVI